jgi:Arc/MetJ-type ribon-helix-helix transcriptional regulator
MAGNVHDLRPKTLDSEKITVNLGFIDLGRVDLMVRDGFYANRADFIRTAIRNRLERQDDAVRQSVARRQLKLGLSHYTAQDLEAARDVGTPLHIQILGLASIASDVTPELACAAIRIRAGPRRFPGQPSRGGGSGRPHRLNTSTTPPAAPDRHPACIGAPVTKDHNHERVLENRHGRGHSCLTQAGKLAEAMALLQGHTATGVAQGSSRSGAPGPTKGIKRLSPQ